MERRRPFCNILGRGTVIVQTEEHELRFLVVLQQAACSLWLYKVSLEKHVFWCEGHHGPRGGLVGAAMWGRHGPRLPSSPAGQRSMGNRLVKHTVETALFHFVGPALYILEMFLLSQLAIVRFYVISSRAGSPCLSTYFVDLSCGTCLVWVWNRSQVVFSLFTNQQLPSIDVASALSSGRKY